MTRRSYLLSIAVVCGCALAWAEYARTATPESSTAPTGRRIPNFVLADAAGKQVGLADCDDKRLLVVVFTGTECPIANAYVPTLNDLAKEYSDKGVGFLAINASAADTPESIAKHAAEFHVAFPVLVDARQSVAGLFGAKRLAEVYVLDARRNVRYRGRIDDRVGYDYKRDEPRRRDLVEALNELLADQPVSVRETEAAGCLITRRAKADGAGSVTYSGQVAKILHERCADCHHPGTAAPFALLSYDDAASRADMIAEVVRERRMPPWHADPRYGKFKNERRLSDDEVETLCAWAEHGAPAGEQGSVAEAPKQTEGWRIGQPDKIFQMPEEYSVPAQGTVRYQYFRTPTDFKEDMWIQAAQPRPGNAAVVHHIVVFYRHPDRPRDVVWLAAMAPGSDPLILPPGYGRKIPAGAELVWQMHYTPNGKEGVDRSEIGLVFCKEPPEHDVQNYGVSNRRFQIPPGDANFEVVSSVPIIKNAVILALYPHMHVRGKSFTYEAQYPDGRKELLLSVPQYDFNWQNTYRLAEPLKLPQGSMIRCVAHFDNSAANPANPDPSKTVRWGDQTWDEMMTGYVDFYFEEEERERRQ